MPFNRAQRSWVYRAAKNIDSTAAFGSTHPLNQPADIVFLNGLFPPLDEEIQPRSSLTFGEGFARHPYVTSSFFNISAMSFGALSPFHLEGGCERIHERGLDYAPDFFTVDSADGGTGAAPQSLIDFMGLPVRCSLLLVVGKLQQHGLRQRIRVICSGKMINPGGVAAALCLGADCVNSARGFMFALGCVQALQCNKNTCPTGITTHDEDLQKGLNPKDKAHRVAHYASNLMHDVETIAHSCGVAEPRLLDHRHAQVINETGMPEPMENFIFGVVSAPGTSQF